MSKSSENNYDLRKRITGELAPARTGGDDSRQGSQAAEPGVSHMVAPHPRVNSFSFLSSRMKSVPAVIAIARSATGP